MRKIANITAEQLIAACDNQNILESRQYINYLHKTDNAQAIVELISPIFATVNEKTIGSLKNFQVYRERTIYLAMRKTDHAKIKKVLDTAYGKTIADQLFLDKNADNDFMIEPLSCYEEYTSPEDDWMVLDDLSEAVEILNVSAHAILKRIIDNKMYWRAVRRKSNVKNLDTALIVPGILIHSTFMLRHFNEKLEVNKYPIEYKSDDASHIEMAKKGVFYITGTSESHDGDGFLIDTTIYEKGGIIDPDGVNGFKQLRFHVSHVDGIVDRNNIAVKWPSALVPARVFNVNNRLDDYGMPRPAKTVKYFYAVVRAALEKQMVQRDTAYLLDEVMVKVSEAMYAQKVAATDTDMWWTQYYSSLHARRDVQKGSYLAQLQQAQIAAPIGFGIRLNQSQVDWVKRYIKRNAHALKTSYSRANALAESRFHHDADI